MFGWVSGYMIDVQFNKHGIYKSNLNCHLCGSKYVRLLFSELRKGRIYNNYHCPDCDLYQTLGDLEPISPDYVDLEEEDLDPAHRFLQTVHKLRAFHQWKKLVNQHYFSERFTQANVLDVGCGIGGFLDFARYLGLTTYGFDASNAHVIEAQSRHDNVRHATSVREYFERLSALPRIDVVTLWDVFEHVRNPKQFLAELREILKCSGGILFVSVPSGSMNPVKVRIASILQRPIGLIPWEHVFYYTPKSLRRMLQEMGFEVLMLGGVEPYVRQPLTVHEGLRRVAHNMLRNTPYALQIFALARVA